MPDRFAVDAAYARALEWNQAAFAAGHYEVAYHFLMAAFHCAEDARDPAGLGEVGRRCGAQLRAIDADAPDHRLSSRSAQTRGHRSVFEMGVIMADAAALRLTIPGRPVAHPAG